MGKGGEEGGREGGRKDKGPVKTMHGLLKRQLRRYFGDSSAVPDEWRQFVEAVNDAYEGFDADRSLMERSLDLSSQELLSANSQMRAVFQAIPDLLFRLDRDGTILEFKAGGLADFYLKPGELLGKRIQDVPLIEVKDKFREAISQVHEKKGTVSIEYSLELDNRRNFYEARLVPFLEDQIIVIVRNITERRMAEEELRRAKEELEQKVAERTEALESELSLRKQTEEKIKEHTTHLEVAIKELADFSYSISHDLRAPLRAIDGFSQVILEDYRDAMNAQGRDYLQRVRKASQKMGDLIDCMQRLAGITRSDMRRMVVNISAMAHSIASGLKARDPSRRVDFVIAKDLRANADPGMMHVVLENLLGNAWKFTLRHETARIELGTMQHEGQTAYFVRDDGVGFDMIYADKLFHAFHRLHPYADYEGMGVGLAVVQRIVHRHGGRVWAESAIGEGATFYFTLAE